MLVTFGIDCGIAFVIVCGFLIYRKCRGDKIKRRKSLVDHHDFHEDFLEKDHHAEEVKKDPSKDERHN